MTTAKQITANRKNAKRSTGPKTEQGKLRSRQNAFRHGLAAETVIAITEDVDEYIDFESLIVADYQPQTTIEHALVVRLASLLWRLRRGVAIETGLFQAQARIIKDRRLLKQHEAGSDLPQHLRSFIPEEKFVPPEEVGIVPTSQAIQESAHSAQTSWRPKISQCFFHLANANGDTLERIGRYEVGLWRQTAQIILVLNSLRKTSKGANFGTKESSDQSCPRSN